MRRNPSLRRRARPRRRLLLPSFLGYDRRWLGIDLVAGLTVWAVLVPESLAYASIAGVSPVVGLYAAPPRRCSSTPLFGSSRHLIVGPMSATAALSAAAVADARHRRAGQRRRVHGGAGDHDRACWRCSGGLLRLGFLANFISEPVLKGFIVGLALTIIVGQLPKLFGIAKGEGELLRQLWDVVTHLGDTTGLRPSSSALARSPSSSGCGGAPAVPARSSRSSSASSPPSVFDLTSHGVAIVGHIDSGLPSFGLPDGLEVQDYLATRGLGRRHHARRLRRGPRRGQDLRRHATTTTSTPTAS